MPPPLLLPPLLPELPLLLGGLGALLLLLPGPSPRPLPLLLAVVPQSPRSLLSGACCWLSVLVLALLSVPVLVMLPLLPLPLLVTLLGELVFLTSAPPRQVSTDRRSKSLVPSVISSRVEWELEREWCAGLQARVEGGVWKGGGGSRMGGGGV